MTDAQRKDLIQIIESCQAQHINKIPSSIEGLCNLQKFKEEINYAV